MKHHISEKISIPEGISCSYTESILRCTKDSTTLERKIKIPLTEVKVQGNEIIFDCKKGNKNNYKTMRSAIAHIKNMFSGLNEKFVYKLESCNVHFPMTLKVEGTEVLVNNFIGEKKPRRAKILPGVEVKIEGAKITVTSSDREAAGQTAANLEKATSLKGRDRRIFQDGIYITEKPGRKI
ncbi:MAG: 50S ribosomal protein L6 [Nanoarchaeota archaeon]|nr:50S ribosomal protein L6 [Nanoarchaeota archaeon]MBU0977794.1 50S ribosomal protein L6 [Nanoarchaeota archaeon]